MALRHVVNEIKVKEERLIAAVDWNHLQRTKNTYTCYCELQLLLTKFAVADNLAAEIVGACRRRFEGVGRRGGQ